MGENVSPHRMLTLHTACYSVPIVESVTTPTKRTWLEKGILIAYMLAAVSTAPESYYLMTGDITTALDIPATASASLLIWFLVATPLLLVASAYLVFKTRNTYWSLLGLPSFLIALIGSPLLLFTI